MVSQQLPVTRKPQSVSSEAQEDERPMLQGSLPSPLGPIQLDTALPPELARRVVEEVFSVTRPVRCRLAAEHKGKSVSLELPLRMDPEVSSGFRLITPDNREIEFVLGVHHDRRLTIRLYVRYGGLPVDKALSYARFVQALLGSEGTLYLDRLELDEERIELVPLPLPIDPATKDDADNRVHFLQALSEIERATGAEFLYPAVEEVGEDDLENINYVLEAIRVGWITVPIVDFTTPTNSEGVRNFLEVTAQEEGGAIKQFAMTTEGEQFPIFDVQVNLGPSVHFVSAARLDTPRSDMESWLATNPGPDDSFNVRWVPTEDDLYHIIYQELPKPSLIATREDIRAFEEDTGRSSAEFRRAWEDGEAWARELEYDEVWLTLLDAEHHLERGS